MQQLPRITGSIVGTIRRSALTAAFGLRSFIRSKVGRLDGIPAELPDGIDPSLVKKYQQSRPLTRRKGFCNAPSANMLFSQDGSVKACCHNTTFVIGKYPEQSISEIWNSSAAQEFRDKMDRFDLKTGCDICEADFRNENFYEMPARHFDNLPLHPKYPVMMEFLVSNQCNLECVMCDGQFSSLIRKNREKLPPIPTAYDAEFLQQLEEFIPYLQEARFSGSGEAFSIDMNYDIWEMILRLNPKCLIVIQTNGTILTGRVKDILERGKFQIGVSLDSLKKDVFEAIRLNANFDKVMENIRYFHEYSTRNKRKFTISTCVMRQNWSELPDFIRFCNSMNAVAMFHKVWFPRKYALHNLPYSELKHIVDTLSGEQFPESTLRERQNKGHYKYMVFTINQWMESAKLLESEKEKVGRLAKTELVPYLTQKLSSHLSKAGADPAENDKILGICLEKHASLMALYPSEPEREAAMRQICTVPANEVLPALQHQPVEFLFEESKKYLK